MSLKKGHFLKVNLSTVKSPISDLNIFLLRSFFDCPGNNIIKIKKNISLSQSNENHIG